MALSNAPPQQFNVSGTNEPRTPPYLSGTWGTADDPPSKSRPITSSQFAALEPSWAGIESEQHLNGLLIVGALFSKTLLIHDTQLGDNPHLIRSFASTKTGGSGLFFELLRGLIDSRVLRVGVRDVMVVAQGNETIACNNLMDVYESWRIQNMPNAWVTPIETPFRKDMLIALDQLLEHQEAFRYSYVLVKEAFMRNVRTAWNTPQSRHRYLFDRLPGDLQKHYVSTLEKDWFSHSDIFQLLRSRGLPLSHPFVEMHGLFDEAAHADLSDARLVGCDGKHVRAWEIATTGRQSLLSRTHNAVLAEAVRRLDVPGLALIGDLKANEVLTLREKATTLWNLIDHADLAELAGTGADVGVTRLRDNLVEAMINYWDHIAEYIRKSRPGLTQARTKLGLFCRDRLPGGSRWVTKHASLTLDVGLDILNQVLPWKIPDDIKNKLLEALSFRFVFFTDRPQMKQLRDALPTHSWISRYKPEPPK